MGNDEPLTDDELEGLWREIVGQSAGAEDYSPAWYLSAVANTLYTGLKRERAERDALRARIAALEAVLVGVAGGEPPISDLTIWPGAGCAYCDGPHFYSAYDRAMQVYHREHVGRFRDPFPGEDTYAPVTEHTDDCPWQRARAALAGLEATRRVQLIHTWDDPDPGHPASRPVPVDRWAVIETRMEERIVSWHDTEAEARVALAVPVADVCGALPAMATEKRPWPPTSVRGFIALKRYDADQRYFWQGEARQGYLACLEDLEEFLTLDWSQNDALPGEGDDFPRRTEPPPVEGAPAARTPTGDEGGT